VASSTETPKRNLPARLEPTLLSTEAANLLHSLVYDAGRMGAATPGTVGEDYVHLAQSRMNLVRYISQLETLLNIPQHQFYRFD